MSKKITSKRVSDNYLKMLEKAQEQYQQYVEVSGLYDLPTQKDNQAMQYQPPSPEHPLTTNTLVFNRG